MNRTVALVLATTMMVSSGCHARFKRNVASIDAVRVQTMNRTLRPTVTLGRTSSTTLYGSVVNTMQMSNEYEAMRIIHDAVDPEAVSWALEDGIAKGLGPEGPPFGYRSGDERGWTMQIEVLDYGLEAWSLGSQGDFNYDLRVRIFDEHARVVYNARQSCEIPAGDPSLTAVAFGGVNNIKQLREMEPGEIQRTFEEVARACGTQVVSRMRWHAG